MNPPNTIFVRDVVSRGSMIVKLLTTGVFYRDNGKLKLLAKFESKRASLHSWLWEWGYELVKSDVNYDVYKLERTKIEPASQCSNCEFFFPADQVVRYFSHSGQVEYTMCNHCIGKIWED